MAIKLTIFESKCAFAPDQSRRLPIARVRIKSHYIDGEINAAICTKPIYKILIGNKFVQLSNPEKPGFQSDLEVVYKEQKLDLGQTVTVIVFQV